MLIPMFKNLFLCFRHEIPTTDGSKPFNFNKMIHN